MVERLQTSVGVVAGFVAAPPPAIPDSDPNLPAASAPLPAATAEEIFRLVYQQVRKLAGRRDVDELAQAAAEQAIRSLPRFAGRSALSTWTFRICYLTIRKHDRWYRRWLRRFTLTEDGHLPESAAERRASTDERLVADERARRLRAALAQLSPKRRTVVVLHDLEGFSVDEVAEIVEALPRAVRSRLRDGRRALAELLAQDPYFGVEACRGKARS
jgi:RNA polymerase sigma-70 factor (ECF subfamily)